MNILDIWYILCMTYSAIAILTFLPVLCAILQKVTLNPGGESFEKSIYFSEEEKIALKQHFTRIHGTLIFWKNQAEKYKRFHLYTLFWTIPSSVLIPLVTQFISDGNASKQFLTLISTFVAILVAFHRAFKVEDNYKAFRHGESEFYDTYRRLLDTPNSFGKSSTEQIENYFQQVEQIRRFIRKAETDNLATADEKIKSRT